MMTHDFEMIIGLCFYELTVVMTKTMLILLTFHTVRVGVSVH